MSCTNPDGSVTLTGGAGRKGEIFPEIFDLLAAGLTTRQIMKRTGHPEGTVYRHRQVQKVAAQEQASCQR